MIPFQPYNESPLNPGVYQSFGKENIDYCAENVRQESCPILSPYDNLKLKPATEANQQSQSIIQSQRVNLCGQGEFLVQKIISLVDIGTSLGILSSNHRLQNLLSNAQAELRALRKSDGVQSDSHMIDLVEY